MQIDRPIATAVILFIILLLIFFLVMPEYNNFRSLQTELGEKKAEFNAEHDYYNAISATYSELQDHKDSIKKIDDALPTDSNLGNLIYYVENTAAENGVIVKSIFFGNPGGTGQAAPNARNVRALNFSVSLMGSYASLGNYIRALERSSRLFEISTISFNSGSGAVPVSALGAKAQPQTQPMYSFSLEINTHTY